MSYFLNKNVLVAGGAGLIGLAATATVGGVMVTIGVTATAISKITKI